MVNDDDNGIVMTIIDGDVDDDDNDDGVAMIA